jgi:acetyl esterase/lipase
MDRHLAAPAVALLAALAGLGATALSGCFGGGGGERSRDMLHARTTHTRLDGPIKVERVVYSSSGGRRVAGLFATPRGVSPRGCLIWEGGLHSRKEDLKQIWDGAARLGLAVFSIDLRYGMLRRSLADLERGVDYLQRRRECRRNVAYGGLGAGGMIGSVLAGRDRRIRAAVLISAGPTWSSLIGAERSVPKLDPVRWIPSISPRPVLVMTGTRDPSLPRRAAARVESAARSPKRLVRYRGGESPFKGPDTTRNAFAIESFLLRWVVKPTYPS